MEHNTIISSIGTNYNNYEREREREGYLSIVKSANKLS